MRFGAKDVAIVLGEGPHTHDAVQAARGFIAVALAKFAKAQGQVAVTLDALVEDDDVPGAVHRLQGEVAFLGLGDKHVLAVFVPVPGFLPQALVQDLRRFDFLVAVVAVDTAHVLLDLLPQHPTLGMPKHGAGGMFVDVEQIEFAAQLAVVPLLGFFQHGQVLLQIFFAGPSRAVNPLQHFIAVVAAPIGPGHFHQLEVFELAGAGHVRATAQVFKRTFAVQRNVFIGRDAGDDVGFVVLAQAFEIRHRFVARQNTAHHGLIELGQLRHFLFNGFQIFRRERTRIREVVEKTVLNDRANGDLRLWKQSLHGIGQQVGSGMANHFQALRIFGGDDGQAGGFGDDVTGVHHLAVHLACQGGLGQARTNRGGHLGHAHGAWVVTLRTVGKSDLNHVPE